MYLIFDNNWSFFLIQQTCSNKNLLLYESNDQALKKIAEIYVNTLNFQHNNYNSSLASTNKC